MKQVKHWIYVRGLAEQGNLCDSLDRKLNNAGFKFTGAGSDGRQWDISVEAPDLEKDVVEIVKICEQLGLKHYDLSIQHLD